MGASKLKTGAQLGIDVGGTFVDIVLRTDDGCEHSDKLLAEPDKLIQVIEDSVAKLLAGAGIEGSDVYKVIHATTRGCNAVLERKGPDIALITTRGFRDVLQIGRALRWSMYDVQMDKPTPLVPRSRSFEVTERCMADGSVRTKLIEEELRLLADEFQQKNITSVVVSFMHSYIAPEHERRAKAFLLEQCPELEVTISSDVSLQGREYERTSTAVVNAYLTPVLGAYFRDLAAMLPRLGINSQLWIMQSSGGLATAEQAAKAPVSTLESGPAAGVLASTHFGSLCGHKDLLSFDMGGTTAKTAIVEAGVPSKTTYFELERSLNRRGSGLPVDTPTIDLVEIGAGGGSIAEPRLGILNVGPQSAGAQPGPSCYGLGGDKPTVTDANLLLGYLNHERFAGGSMSLDLESANKAMDTLASQLDLDRIRTAWGIYEVVNLEMERALRLVSIDRGFDPRSFVLVCIGGAAAVHGSYLARALGIEKMIVPPGAGVGSAIGLLQALESVELAQSGQILLDEADASERANSILKSMEDNARKNIEGSWSDKDLSVRRAVGLRYAGQGFELKVGLNESGDIDIEQLAESFHVRYEQNYGYRETSLSIEAVTWYLTVTREQEVSHSQNKLAGSDKDFEKLTRSVYLGDAGFVDTLVIDRSALRVGVPINGPCIIEEAYTTTLVLPDDVLTLDASGALVIEIGSTE
ncbi:MAG: hydantoinase/oxoprolinase family protein [Gammaproteobacteria bacterium]|nr:hydantoinase/oxoprolinase family protein [Gammaproteobacteria bacterium]